MASGPLNGGLETAEIRKQVDSGGSAGAERETEPQALWPPVLAKEGPGRLGLGEANGSTPLCSHQRALVPAAGAASCPCLWACPSPSRASAASGDIHCLPPALEPTRTHREEKRTPHRASSIPRLGAGLGSGPVLALAGTAFLLPSFTEEQPREHLPFQATREARDHSALSFSVLESNWEGSPAPKSPSPRTLSILLKSSKVKSSHGPTANSGHFLNSKLNALWIFFFLNSS